MRSLQRLQDLYNSWIPKRNDSEKQAYQSPFVDGAYEQDTQSSHYTEPQTSAYTHNMANQAQLPGNQFPQQQLGQQPTNMPGQFPQQQLGHQPAEIPGFPVGNAQHTAYENGYVKEEPRDSPPTGFPPGAFPQAEFNPAEFPPAEYPLPDENMDMSGQFDGQYNAQFGKEFIGSAFPPDPNASANAQAYYRGFTPPPGQPSMPDQAANVQVFAYNMNGQPFVNPYLAPHLHGPNFHQPQGLAPQHGYYLEPQHLQHNDIQDPLSQDSVIPNSVEYQPEHEPQFGHADTEMSDNSYSSASEQPQIPVDAAAVSDDIDGYSEYEESGSEHEDEENEESESDDDKPLMMRVQNSPSTQGKSKSPSVEVTVVKAVEKKKKKGETTPAATASAATSKKAGKKAVTTEKPVEKKTEQPKPLQGTQQPQQQKEPENTIDLTTPILNWKLPEFEFIYTTPATPSTLPTAKISLPGLVRHELILSIDHHAIEAHLFEHVFLPAQRTLHSTSPEGAASLDPKLSVLNFHTIAGLCIEAFYHATSPDADLGLGPSTSNGGNSVQGSAVMSTKKRKPPTLATLSTLDIDSVFFAIMDNYRIGLLARRDNYFAIRGVQEFCDVALDVCFFVKENGMVGAGRGVKEDGSERIRRERSDKGVKRGPRGGGEGGKKEREGDGEWDGEEEEEGFAKPKGKATGGNKKVNVVEARKKPKLKSTMGQKGKGMGKGKVAANKVKGGKVQKKRK